MPAGLDGNPSPVRTPQRDEVLDAVVGAILAARGRRGPTLVGVDGESGAGKSTFADELANRLRKRHALGVVRSTTDSFHNPRTVRLQPGVDRAESYYRWSHDLESLREELLDPMKQGTGGYRAAIFDEPSDLPVDEPEQPIDPSCVLVFDGLFLHRPELRDYWDVSVFLDASERKRNSLMDWAERESCSCGAIALLRSGRISGFMHRYWDGWRVYEKECEPRTKATFVIDNNEIERPSIVSHRVRTK